MNKKFPLPLRFQHDDGGRKLTLTEPFAFCVGCEGSSEIIRLPVGFSCDGQSYPRLLWFIDTPLGDGAQAGFVHDYLYFLAGTPHPESGISYSRWRSDAIYFEALRASGLNLFSCIIRYVVLRCAGWRAWNHHKKGRKAARESLS